ncbi:endopeptidase La [Microbacter margulisiae]|uniref:Lon protease n=1 Tax=Microbacter margulisiae TaxID=1350067 RepID=A0A7W5DQA7_9PORP|nr:endopeptidase La [Microbacter margulisiae]MBB3187120.1 ATP-dependent Lon protease [Microbacter margulisiae]
MDILLNKILSNDSDESTGYLSIVADNSESESINLSQDELIPVLPLRNMVMFPNVVLPIAVSRNKSLRLIREVYKNNGVLAATTQKDIKVDDPGLSDLYPIGTIARIVRILEMPDNSTTVLLQGITRFELLEITSKTPFHQGFIKTMTDQIPNEDNRVFVALIEAIKDLAIKIIQNSGTIPPETTFAIRNIDNPEQLINYITGNFALKVTEKQRLLEIDDLEERGYQLLEILNKESQLLEIKASIQSKAREDIDQQQREYFLQQQMKTIQDELGGGTSEQQINEMREKAALKKWNKEVAELFEKELSKLERTHPHSPDYPVQMNYVETILELPWNEYTKDNFDLKRAKRTLDRDHFGLEKVKDRILEHLAVLKLKGDLKSPILCLYGPPGVGKTSLGKSIAETLNRKYIRISLGGLHDEAEIRGHRRTYIGAMPGRIIQNIKKAGSANPVIVLDEIDKVNSDFKGDPSSALLEVLDPEQNSTFHDNYLDIDFDLSKILFIATANTIQTISQPLLDRMELIDVSGYITEEKIEIAIRHLIPRQRENHGLTKEQCILSKEAVRAIIESYTRESGVRELDRKIAKIMRQIAKKVATNETYEIDIPVEELKNYLGAPLFTKDLYEGNDYIGVVTGLAWTSVGGEILFIETSLSKSKAPTLTLTGNLGNVMKESAILALEYIKAHATQLNIDESLFETMNVHVHVPEGAIPKDGPSAGITMVTAMTSAFTGHKVKKALAMTGEMTLRGKVLPVGGIKEKILAAKRANIKEVILCHENQKDIEEIKSSYLKGLKFHFVSDIREVLDIALIK